MGDGSLQCTDYAPGTFTAVEGSTACRGCEAGEHVEGPACVKCEEGKFSTEANQEHCVECGGKAMCPHGKRRGRCRLTYATTSAGNILAEFTVTRTGTDGDGSHDFYLCASRDYAQHDLAVARAGGC